MCVCVTVLPENLPRDLPFTDPSSLPPLHLCSLLWFCWRMVQWGGRILLQRTSSPYFAVALSSSGGDGGAVVVGDRSVGGRGRKESSAITEDLPRELQQMLQKECVAAVSHTGTFVAFCTTSNRPVCCLYDVVHNSCHVIGSVPFREGPVSTDQKDGVRCGLSIPSPSKLVICFRFCTHAHTSSLNQSIASHLP